MPDWDHSEYKLIADPGKVMAATDATGAKGESQQSADIYHRSPLFLSDFTNGSYIWKASEIPCGKVGQ